MYMCIFIGHSLGTMERRGPGGVYSMQRWAKIPFFCTFMCVLPEMINGQHQLMRDIRSRAVLVGVTFLYQIPTCPVSIIQKGVGPGFTSVVS